MTGYKNKTMSAKNGKQSSGSGSCNSGECRKTVAVNRKSRHEYEIEDSLTSGLVLTVTEIKYVRAGRVNIADAYARIERGEAWLHNMHISPHLEGNRFNVDPVRSRKLLLNRREIDRLRGITEQKGLTLIPLALVLLRGYAKLELGVGRGKKLYDKRQSIAERDRDREARREVFGRT